jgi:DHA1 family inner membrane transport protein
VLYVGQAIGSGIGGFLYAHESLRGIGYAGIAFVVLALVTVIATRRVVKT